MIQITEWKLVCFLVILLIAAIIIIVRKDTMYHDLKEKFEEYYELHKILIKRRCG